MMCFAQLGGHTGVVDRCGWTCETLLTIRVWPVAGGPRNCTYALAPGVATAVGTESDMGLRAAGGRRSALNMFMVGNRQRYRTPVLAWYCEMGGGKEQCYLPLYSNTRQ
eukprot:1117161-Pleurochrysis_carterae.AAC.1